MQQSVKRKEDLHKTKTDELVRKNKKWVELLDTAEAKLAQFAQHIKTIREQADAALRLIFAKMHNVSALDKQLVFAEFLKIFNEPIKAIEMVPAESTGLLEYSLKEH